MGEILRHDCADSEPVENHGYPQLVAEPLELGQRLLHQAGAMAGSQEDARVNERSCADRADQQRNASAVDDPGQQIPTVQVGS